MKLRVLVAIALALSALSSFADGYIVEFRSAPGAPSTLSEDTHQRFRADLARLTGVGAASVRSSARASVVHEYRSLFHGAAIELSSATAIRQLLALPYVANVHLDRRITADGTVERSRHSRSSNVASHSGGRGIVVAVLDSGVDYTHPALGGGFGPGYKVRGGYDFVNDDADPMDDHRHGTHVAGIIAASSAELTGIAPEASLLAYKVLDKLGQGDQSDLLAALERAIDPNGDGDPSDRAHVINISLGSPGHPSDPVAQAVDRASALGAVVVVSVGNSGEDHAIMSPALARTALAVGAVDGGRRVAEFSARGPAAQSFAPRPDVLAPGVLVRSAAIGGGTLTMSGTSMAAPHVAAVAARILEEHPTWSSERVRSAIIYSGYPVPGASVLSQGTGPIDIPNAMSSSVFIQPNPLGFGVIDRSADVWRAQRSIRLQSEYDVPVTIRGEAANPPAGVTITFTPQEVVLQPRVEQQIEVTIEVDVKTVDAQQQGLAFGGWVKLVRGAVDAYVPWAVVRAARVRTTTAEEFPQIVWSTDGVARGSIAPLDPYTTEALIEPATYDLAIVGSDASETRVYVRERLKVDGDLQLDMTAADAPHAVKWEASDPSGALLSSGSTESRLYTVAGRLLFADGPRKWSIELPSSLESLRSSSFGERWSLLLTESVIDVTRSEIITAQHPPLSALSSDRVLRTSSSDYAMQPVEAVFPGDAAERNVYFLPRNITRRGIEAGRRPNGIGIANVPPVWRGSVWMTPEVHGDYASGVQIGLYTGDPAMHELASVIVPMLRRRGDGFVSTSDIDPAPVPVAVVPGELLQWGAGAIWPSVRVTRTATQDGRAAWTGTIDVLGDRNEKRRRETTKAAWRLLADDGAVLDGGAIGTGSLFTRPSTARRLELLVASPETERSFASTGLLQIEMAGASDDVTPPTLTSFAILDDAGRHVRQVRRGSAARIVFSAADASIGSGGNLYAPIVETQTKLLVRVHGSAQWHEVQTRIVQEDAGGEEEPGRAPAGFVYEGQLANVTVAGAVDVRIELVDRSGHRASWSLSPAFRIDDAARRRSARH